MAVKGTLDLNYYGFTGDSSKYLVKWNSTDPTVASVTKDGIVLARKAGLTTIQLSLISLYENKTITAVPVALQVGATVPVATPTTAPAATPTTAPVATPTTAPVATPTAVPTVAPSIIPTVTPTVTPEPTSAPATYKVKVETDSCFLVTFNRAVDYEREDIEVFQLISVGNTPYEYSWDIDKVELNSTGTELRIYSEDTFENGVYLLRVNGEKDGVRIPVNIGTVNKIVLSYECLGKENAAYACVTDDDEDLDIPVNLSYQLYYNDINVTETYMEEYNDIEYEIVSAKNKDSFSISGDSIYFYEPNERLTLRAKYYYTDANGREKELNSAPITIVPKDLGDYTILAPQQEWTIVHNDFEGKIDWSNPVHSVVAGEDNYKIVALIADNYGNKYSTDERGVDTANGIYSIEDETQLFYKKDYAVKFATEMESEFFVFPDGELFTYQKVNKAVASITLEYSDNYGNERTKNIGVCSINILSERKLDEIVVKDEHKSITLATNALQGFEERFCEIDVPIQLYDQYDEPWKGDYDLELSCSIEDVDDAIHAGVGASLEGNVLHINAMELKEVTKRDKVTLVVKETESGAKVSISVSLKTPTTSNGSIQVTSWKLNADNVAITFDSDNLYNSKNEAVIELFKLSKNNIEVGLEKGNVYLLDEKNPKFDVEDDYKVGDYYMLITNPDGDVVEEAASSDDLGVWVDEDEGAVKVNLTSLSSGLMLDFLESGKYSVTVYKITNVTEKRVVTDKESTTFTVTDDTKDVTYKTMRGTKTEIDVNSQYDVESVKEIVAELIVFRLGDSTWSDLTANMITDAKFRYKEAGDETFIIVQSVEFAVPVNGKDENVLTYSRTVNKGLNKSIRVGVDD